MSVPELLAGKRICICAGSGGVGKTTTSAVIALGMAARGLSVCVITIDPARRLANALGLQELSNEPAPAGSERFAAAGLEMEGELWAMMLDPKRTFDDLIEAAAPTPERAEAIKVNEIYQQISSAVAGSQEFTAVSKLYELAESGRFDLLVLDTPPARNARDFLEAPKRLTEFLDGRALGVLARPTGVGLRLVGLGTSTLLSGLKRLTGMDLIGEISTFLGLLGPMAEVFSGRARAVEALLRSPDSAFVLVASAQADSIDEALAFRQTLAAGGLPFAGMIVNRFHPDLGGAVDTGELTERLARVLGADGELAARVADSFVDDRALADRDRANLIRLEAGLDGAPIICVPQFDADIHDVAGLMQIYAHLFA